MSDSESKPMADVVMADRRAVLEEAAKVCEAHLNNIEADDPYRQKDRQHCDEMDTADGYLRNAAEAIRSLSASPAPVDDKDARIKALEEALKEVTECFSEDYSIAHPRSQAALKLASQMTKPRD